MFQPVDLISLRYQAMQEELHGRPHGYGGKGGKWAPAVVDLVRQYEASSVLDYGCGRGSLKAALSGLLPTSVRISEYDPAILGKRDLPEFADIVSCTDVLEHIEPEKLSVVLSHLHMLARKAVFLVVALDEANKTLEDGRNAHLILESPEWWQTRVADAGFFVKAPNESALPCHYTPEKRSKRWISVAVPC